jgi:hypothetical protein
MGSLGLARRVQAATQFFDTPYVILDSGFHRESDAQGLMMHTAEVAVVQCTTLPKTTLGFIEACKCKLARIPICTAPP